MFELTNEQRKCFGLPPVSDTWEKVKIKPSPYDEFSTFTYLDGQRIKKVILVNDEQPGKELYSEFQVDAMLSEDGKTLLPKTEKGKPKLFTSGNLLKCTPIGMSVNYSRKSLSVTNNTSQQSYYCSEYDDVKLESFCSFKEWVENWCKNTGEKEQRDIEEFAKMKRRHQKYNEGDFFRFRINRKLYGYGRILLDFNKMRKDGVKFWDIFMGKPLCVAVYHIVTERDDIKPEQLLGLPMLPSQMIMDNIFYYGECVIIGNAPITEEKDYPIHYGRSISIYEKGLRYQCGKTYLESDDEKDFHGSFRNNAIGWGLDLKLSILKKCIEEGSNMPYWNLYNRYKTNEDLRNPKYKKELEDIKHRMGVE